MIIVEIFLPISLAIIGGIEFGKGHLAWAVLWGITALYVFVGGIVL